MTTRLEAHLAAIAATCTLAPVSANASIVYSGLVNINVPSNVDGVYLNVVTGVSGSTSAGAPGWDVNPWSATELAMFTLGAGRMVGSGTEYFNLGLDAIIGPGSSFAAAGVTHIAASTPLAFNSSFNFFGFSFLNELTGQLHYGWMRVELGASAFAQPRTIFEYAYESIPGVPIGFPIPAPSASLTALLAVGGVAGARSRRKR